MAPIGPIHAGVHWLPFLIVGLIVALVLAAATPPSDRRQSTVEFVGPEEKSRERKEQTFVAVLNYFFWIFLVVVLVAIFVRYWI